MRLIGRLLMRDWRAGEVRLLLASIALSVLAISAVGMLTDRAQAALAQEANRLLGGDLALRADLPIPPATLAKAKSLQLQISQSARFPSMARSAGGVQLFEWRAVQSNYPLRGQFELRDARGNGKTVKHGPTPGTVWLSAEALRGLNAGLGDSIGVGDLNLRVDAILQQEPDAALDYFNVAPRAVMAFEDLPRSGLVQPGSRIAWRLVVAGAPAAVTQFEAYARQQLARGQRLESVRDARPEIRNALDRAHRFLTLTTLVSVVLAAIAMALATRRHVRRHLDGTAVMRCLGASQNLIVRLFVGKLIVLTVLASGLGLLLAFALQAVIAHWLANAMQVDLPWPGWQAVVSGLGVGLIVVAGFALPPVLSLKNVPAMRVLRRDLDWRAPSAWMVAGFGILSLLGLMVWQAGSWVLSSALLIGLGLALLALALLGLILLAALRLFRGRLRGVWRLGLSPLTRRAGASILQITALGLGLTVLLLLVLLRTDLLARWQHSLPSDAPNRFIINVQSDQVQPVQAFFDDAGIAPIELFPMVRARLMAVNGKAVTGEDYAAQGERAKRLAEREFNLSSASALREDNAVVEGTFWTTATVQEPQLSVEMEFAKTLGWSLDDVIEFDVAGTPLKARITSLRRVEWDSFKPNFFVLVSPTALSELPASFISTVHLPSGQANLTDELVRGFPNLSVIDVAAVLNQVRGTIEQVSRVVESVFLFAILAGLLVLLAAIQSAQDERLQEGAVMRALGASRAQLRRAHWIEFGVLGALAGGVAAIAATALAAWIARRVFDLPFEVNSSLVLLTTMAGVFITLIAGLIATRDVVQVPPNQVLRELA